MLIFVYLALLPKKKKKKNDLKLTLRLLHYLAAGITGISGNCMSNILLQQTAEWIFFKFLQKMF